MQNLAIILEFGFHEVKKYIHSGLAATLSQKFNIFWFVLEKDKKIFEDYFGVFGQLIFFQESQFPNAPTKIEIRARATAEAWMRNKGIPIYHNYKVMPTQKKGDAILGNSLVKSQLALSAHKKVKNTYANSIVTQSLRAHKITHVLGTSCQSAFAKSVFTSANQIELQTYYLVNSWKDLFVNPFIPIPKFTKIFVWSGQMLQDYQTLCPYIKAQLYKVTGNPSFDPFYEYKPVQSREYYAEKYKLNSNCKWLYYTLMPPGLWDDEILHVMALGKELQENGVDAEILIRRNPNHSKTEFNNLDFPGNCKLTNHYVTYDADKDLIIQTAEGEQEWMDLVYHSMANISIPSTVTLEFLVMNKEVINPGFSVNNDFPKSLMQHFKSGFYHPLYQDSRVHLESQTEDLIQRIKSLKPGKQSTIKMTKAGQQILNHLQ